MSKTELVNYLFHVAIKQVGPGVVLWEDLKKYDHKTLLGAWRAYTARSHMPDFRVHVIDAIARRKQKTRSQTSSTSPRGVQLALF